MGQRHTMLAGMAFGIVWMVAQAVMPAIIGRAIDEGIAAKDTQALLLWTGVMLAIGLVPLQQDPLAVVEDGRITESGSHDELVVHGGSYAGLWESWHGKG